MPRRDPRAGRSVPSWHRPCSPRPHEERARTRGFAPTAEPPAPERSSDGRIGDEALADAVRDALALDASTAELSLNVEVRDAVAHLRGTVAGPEDGENAEAVAAAVPGVVDVADETELEV